MVWKHWEFEITFGQKFLDNHTKESQSAQTALGALNQSAKRVENFKLKRTNRVVSLVSRHGKRVESLSSNCAKLKENLILEVRDSFFGESFRLFYSEFSLKINDSDLFRKIPVEKANKWILVKFPGIPQNFRPDFVPGSSDCIVE